MTGEEKKSSSEIRDLFSFWLLGLCNNFGFVVMLTAAHDIIKELGNDDKTAEKYVRDCNHMSTGVILLADVVPALFLKIVIPFIPGYVHVKIACAVILTICSFLIVAFAEEEWVAVIGVIITSASFGIGEATLVGYTAHFNKNVISTWSSGTGGAAVFGSFCYSVLQHFEVQTKLTLLFMLAIPLLEVAVFFGLLVHPLSTSTNLEVREKSEIKDDNFSTFAEKIKYLPHLLKYIAPLLVIYFSQYLINQGLIELIYFPDLGISKAEQYRWFQVTYQVSVFLARSSVNLCKFKYIWILAILQLFNMIFFSLEAVYYFTPSVFIIFCMISCEGLIGGGAYVNTFYRISEEVPSEKRQFAMSITTFSDAPGIAIAGLVALPLHDLICDLPYYGKP